MTTRELLKTAGDANDEKGGGGEGTSSVADDAVAKSRF